MSKKTTPEAVYEVHWYKNGKLSYIQRPSTRPFFATMAQPRKIVNQWKKLRERFNKLKEEGFPEYMKNQKVRFNKETNDWEYKTRTQEELCDVENNPWFGPRLLKEPKIFKHTMGIISTEEVSLD